MNSTATATIDLDVATYKGKTWLAQITGVGGKFGFEREFVNSVERNLSRSGATGTITYLVTDGVFEANEGRHGRTYYVVAAGVAREVSRDEALSALAGE